MLSPRPFMAAPCPGSGLKRDVTLTFSSRAARALAALALGASAFAAAPAQAHFVLQHSPAPLIERPGDVPVKLIFWHPMTVGHAMQMERPEGVFVLHRGARTDLSDRLTETVFDSDGDGEAAPARAWALGMPVKRSGDYVLVTTPAPYYEESEDVFIQQITKTVFNRNGLPTDWSEPAGLPAEILPLTKPYNVMTGSSFTGQVLSEGEPVAGAEIEIEYLAAAPQMDGTGVAPATVAAPPGGAIVAITGPDGTFTFAVPRAGWWGFAALGVGPATEHAGKELSQDAVLWIHAQDLE